MPLLYNWTWGNYLKDLRFGVGYHLNQGSKRLHDVDVGESLWAFSRRPHDGAYVLIAELVVRAKTMNRAGFRYGPYRLWGSLDESRYFLAEGQARIDQVIRAMSLGVNAKHIGQAFQGHAAVRKITLEDQAMLQALAAELSPEPRARLQPEERFEAIGLFGSSSVVDDKLGEEPLELEEERRMYLYGPKIERRRAWAGQLRGMYQDQCQLCGWSARHAYGHETCESHHMHWISRGGPDELDNLVLLCPNHHRIIHRADAVFDHQDLAFVFTEEHREVLKTPGHLTG